MLERILAQEEAALMKGPVRLDKRSEKLRSSLHNLEGDSKGPAETFRT